MAGPYMDDEKMKGLSRPFKAGGDDEEGPSMWQQAKGLIGLGDDDDDAEKAALNKRMERFTKSRPVGMK